MKAYNRKKTPRVSIGLPVYNGAKYLESAIESVLSQSFVDWELVISDNASSDETMDISQKYASEDSRIHYHRNESNVGAAKNFNQAFHLSSGEFFKWAAHDDMMGPDFLDQCVRILDDNPSVVLCHCNVAVIDEKGEMVSEMKSELPNVSSFRTEKRFRDLILVDHLCLEIFGLIRSCVLRNTPLIGNYIASDRVLMAYLGLLGKFHVLPSHLFFSREHPHRSIRAIPFHFRSSWFDPSRLGEIVFPHWRFYWEYWKCVKRVDLQATEKLECYIHLVKWPFVNANWARLLTDLAIAMFPASETRIAQMRDRYYLQQ